jgi:hypothetical protein
MITVTGKRMGEVALGISATSRMYTGDVEVKLHALLTSTPSHYSSSAPRERALCTQWTGEWVSLRAGLDMVAKRKIPALQADPGLPFCAQSLLTAALYSPIYPLSLKFTEQIQG